MDRRGGDWGSQMGRVSEPLGLKGARAAICSCIHTYRVRLLFQSLEANRLLLNRSARVWLD